jgi:ubiquinone/menaquinone biosynthesis C-methylase UbiE
MDPARISSGESVVEIGCGPGFTACEIANWVGPSGHVDGTDVNAGFIDFGRALTKERVQEMHNKRMQSAVAESHRLCERFVAG